MTLIDLVRRLAVEAGASGGGPVSAVGQTGEPARLVNWVKTAWQDLQLHRTDWFWMRGAFSFQTTPGVCRYDSSAAGILTRFSEWDQNSIRLYQTSVDDELILPKTDYDAFFRAYLVGQQTPGRPVTHSVSPTLDLLIGPVPSVAFTVSGDYMKSPSDLLVDADTPDLPVEYHMAIVYRALMLYARYESAPDILVDAQANYKRLLRRLTLKQQPDMVFSEGLA